MTRSKSKSFPGLAALLILGVIAFTAFGTYLANMGIMKNPRRPYARMIANALESAAYNFYNEYGRLPDVGARVKTDSKEGIDFLHVVSGMESGASPQNPRGVKFLNVREGKNRKNGIIYSATGETLEGVFDQWGSPFTVILDTDGDEILRFKFGSRNVELKGLRVAVFSPGADRQEGTKDDVTTW